MLQALRSSSCDIIHETRGTICYGHWVLRLVISHTRQMLELVPKVDLLPVSGARTSTQVLRSTICCRCLGLELVLRSTICCTREGYDLFRALGSVSCDITHETGGTICYGHGFCVS